jgi:hypothetical protein
MVKNTTVKKLLEALAEKTGQSMDYHGFGKMSDVLENFALEKGMTNISQGYLADINRNIEQKISNNKEKSKTSRDHMDTIACFLGFNSFEQFSLSIDKPISDALKSCLGNWWSIVRYNSGDFLLKAPVRLFRDEKSMEVLIELKGQERTFTGKMTESGSCLSGFIQSKSGKVLGLIFKLSNSQKQEIIQGVFSGISSFGNPIAGRELLLRENELEYDEMHWSKLSIHDPSIPPHLRNYFSESEKNNIKIKEFDSIEFI